MEDPNGRVTSPRGLPYLITSIALRQTRPIRLLDAGGDGTLTRLENQPGAAAGANNGNHNRRPYSTDG